jgi:hypothetical protein
MQLHLQRFAGSRIEVNTITSMFEELYTWLKNERSFYGAANMAMLLALTGEGIPGAARAFQMKSFVEASDFQLPFTFAHVCLH